MGSQDFFFDLVQRGANGLDLDENIDAVAVILDHARDART
jgi:hypothetical protein